MTAHTHTHEGMNPLLDRTYRHLFGAQVTSLVGTGLTTVALALLAHDFAGGDAGAVLGTVLALKMVCYVLVAPAVGGIAHRLPRKQMLIALDVFRAAVVLALPLVDALWQIYVLVGVLNAAAAAFTPTFQATIPDVLPDEATYTRALSLSRLAYDLENLASPSLAALALVFMGYDGLFVGDAITFGVSALLVSTAAMPKLSIPERPKHVLRDMTFGLRSYLATPRLRGMLALHVTASAAGAMVIVNTVVVVQDGLGLGDSETTWAYVATGAGSMAMALLAPRLLQSRSDRSLMLAGGAAATIALIAVVVVGLDLVTLLLLWAAIGLATSAVQVPAGRVLRRSCQPGDRAAFFSAQFALSHGGWLIAYPTAGLVGAAVGLHAAALALGGLAALGLAVGAIAWSKDDPAELEHHHEPVEHKHPHVHDEHHQHEHEGWEGDEPHTHPHQHAPVRHRHAFVVDLHHPSWPSFDGR